MTNEVCAICISEFPIGALAELDSCTHKFCYGCAKEWFHYHSGTCPTCRSHPKFLMPMTVDLDNSVFANPILSYSIPTDLRRIQNRNRRAYETMPSSLEGLPRYLSNGDLSIDNTYLTRTNTPEGVKRILYRMADESLTDASPHHKEIFFDMMMHGWDNFSPQWNPTLETHLLPLQGTYVPDDVIVIDDDDDMTDDWDDVIVIDDDDDDDMTDDWDDVIVIDD